MNDVKALNWLMVTAVAMVFASFMLTLQIASKSTNYGVNNYTVAAFLG